MRETNDALLFMRTAGTERVFPGRSEMAQRMRDFDWSAHELGPPSDWPQNLRTSVRIMLTARQPMLVWWGKPLFTLYNDSYATFLHTKHPWALGEPAAVVWPEIWDAVEPRVEFTKAHDEGTYDEAFFFVMHRKGYPEEVYATFSYSPITDENGEFCGILCPVSEDTERIIGERQLALLRELAARPADARTVEDACKLVAEALATNPTDIPFSLLYLVDSNQRSASLAGVSGLPRGHPLAPETIALNGESLWPELLTERALRVWDLSDSPYELPVVRAEFPVTKAASVFISGSGETGTSSILIAGLNPLLAFDDSYRRFMDLVVAGVSEALTNGAAYEAERRRAEALAEIDRAKTAFFSNVSHEFRTPLTLMLGPLEDELRENPNASERLRVAHRNSLRVLKLVNTLLDFARTEAGRAKAVFQPTDLGSLTRDISANFRSAMERAGLKFFVRCDPLDQTVYVDRDMWEKIVLNLLSNAFKFTLSGSVSVELRRAGEHVELVVTDTGVGIPKDEIASVFERFHRGRADRGRTHEGTGIGLALVKELTELHGGAIEVESVEDEGSAFTVRLPFGKGHLSREHLGGVQELMPTAIRAEAFVEEALRWLPDEDSRQAASTVGSADVRGKVLVADDNADMRDRLRRVLEDQFSVSVASNGEDAFDLALDQLPDVVLADIMMPRLDGFGLLRKLRADDRTTRIPVILLSARAGEESRTEGIDAGADDYIVKPFNARELRSRVASRVKQAQLLSERDSLLKEVHHRVKNNLHVIISLLQMQANRVDDVQSKGQLEEACNRIMSIASIHELLYRRGTFTDVSLGDYAEDVGRSLLRVYGVADRVRLSIEDSGVVLDLDRILSCGLLLHELISNCCKHAFPDGASGEVRIRLASANGSVTIDVADSGSGYSEIDQTRDSLGLKLVRTVVEQNLAGTVRYESKAGARALITIPL